MPVAFPSGMFWTSRRAASPGRGPGAPRRASRGVRRSAPAAFASKGRSRRRRIGRASPVSAAREEAPGLRIRQYGQIGPRSSSLVVRATTLDRDRLTEVYRMSWSVFWIGDFSFPMCRHVRSTKPCPISKRESSSGSSTRRTSCTIARSRLTTTRATSSSFARYFAR